MSSSLRTVLLGSSRNGPGRWTRRFVPPLLFVGVLTAYALDVFAIAGGVVFLAVVAAAVRAFRHAGLAFAWVTAYAALLGHDADHYLLGLSGRSLGDRLAAFLGIEGLVVVGVQAVVLGTLAGIFGRIAARSVAVVRDRRRESAVDSG